MDVQPAGSAKADKTHGWLERARLVLFLKEEYDKTSGLWKGTVRTCMHLRVCVCAYV